MLILTAVQTAQPDYVALAIVVVFAAIVAVMAMRKKVLSKKATPTEAPAPTEASEARFAPGTAGQIKLHNVDPKTAALLMAIVANKTGKPLNQLRFISIKEVE